MTKPQSKKPTENQAPKEIPVEAQVVKETIPQLRFKAEQIDTIRSRALEHARDHILQAYNHLVKSEGEKPLEQKDTYSRQLEAKAQNLGPSDMMIAYDVRILDQAGTLVQLCDEVKLSSFTAQNMLMESRRNFETILYATIIRPLLNQVQNYLNRFIQNNNPLPSDHHGFAPNQLPRLPEARPSETFSDTD